jgi:hypothetical protein
LARRTFVAHLDYVHHATEGPSDTQKPHAVAGSGALLVPNDSGDREDEGGDEGSVEGDGLG